MKDIKGGYQSIRLSGFNTYAFIRVDSWFRSFGPV